MKIEWVNKGEEFEIPTVSLDSDIQMTIDFLKLRVKVEHQVAQELGFDLKEIRKELAKAAANKDYEPSDDAKAYQSIEAIQLNLETVYYVLHRIDPTVTKTMVNGLGGKKLAEIVTAVFPPIQDFPKATETVANSP